MKSRDIYRLYQDGHPREVILRAFREVSLDDSDELYEGYTPLHLACLYTDTEAVQILLERGAETNVRDANGSTPVHLLGLITGRETDEDKLKEITLMLLEHNANVLRSGKKSTALMEAVRNRHFKMAEAIIDSGVRVDSTDCNGENILFGFCAVYGHIQKDIRYARKELDEAVRHHHSESSIEQIRGKIAGLEKDDATVCRLVRRLIEEGKVDPEDKSDCGRTAWDEALDNKAMKIAAILSGGDPDIDKLSAMHGNMDIFQAMYRQNMEALEAVLCSGTDLQTVCVHKEMDEFAGKSPLGCAFCWFDYIKDAPAVILNGGADPNYRFPDEETAFSTWVSKDYRCRDSHIYVGLLDLMRQKGWNPELPVDKEGNTALALACRYTGYRLGKTAVNYLLKSKADPNVSNLFGQTPMMILFGARPVYGNNTPYSRSVSSEDLTGILEKLLDAGGDPDKTDNWGNTVLHYMAAGCHDNMAKEIIELLTDFKFPDVNVVNNDGKTALDIAADCNNDNFIRLLLKYS